MDHFASLNARLSALSAGFQPSAPPSDPYVLTSGLANALSDKVTTTALNTHTGATNNPHGVTKAQVGLGNATNTADADKPVSTAQQSALDTKAPVTGPTLANSGGNETLKLAPTGTQTTASEYRNYGFYSAQTINGTSLLYNGANNRGFYQNGIYGFGNVFAAHAILLTDRLDNGTSSGADGRPSNGIHTVSALYIEHTTGGTNVRGVRETLNTRTIFDAASNTNNVNNNYVSQRSNIIVTASDGGAPGSPRGAFFAENPNAVATDAATNLLELAGGEVNVGGTSGASTLLRYGWSVVGTFAIQGTLADAAFSVGVFSGAAKWRDQFLVSDLHGDSPCDGAGTIIAVRNPNGKGMAVDTVLDFSVLTCNYLLKGQNTALAPNSWVMNAANFGMKLGSAGTTNTPKIDFASGPNATVFDARISATGGSASDGNAVLVLQSAAVQTTGGVRPATDGNVPLGLAGQRWSALYAASGTIQTSDAHLKTNIVAPDDALLDAIEGVEIRLFQYIASVAEKGESAARLHAGVIAQQVAEALAAKGLDARRYALWCEDAVMEDVEEAHEEEVDETREEPYEIDEDVIEGGRAVRRTVTRTRTVPVLETFPLFGEDGQPIMLPARPAKMMRGEDEAPIPDEATGEPMRIPEIPERRAVVTRAKRKTVTVTRTVSRQKLGADGAPETRLALRYDQLLILMVAVERRRAARLAERVAVLEHATSA